MMVWMRNVGFSVLILWGAVASAGDEDKPATTPAAKPTTTAPSAAVSAGSLVTTGSVTDYLSSLGLLSPRPQTGGASVASEVLNLRTVSDAKTLGWRFQVVVTDHRLALEQRLGIKGMHALDTIIAKLRELESSEDPWGAYRAYLASYVPGSMEGAFAYNIVVQWLRAEHALSPTNQLSSDLAFTTLPNAAQKQAFAEVIRRSMESYDRAGSVSAALRAVGQIISLSPYFSELTPEVCRQMLALTLKQLTASYPDSELEILERALSETSLILFRDTAINTTEGVLAFVHYVTERMVVHHGEPALITVEKVMTTWDAVIRAKESGCGEHGFLTKSYAEVREGLWAMVTQHQELVSIARQSKWLRSELARAAIDQLCDKIIADAAEGKIPFDFTT